MLRKLMLDPNFFFQIYPACPWDSKTDKWEYLQSPSQKIFNFFFRGLHTSSMNGFCKNWRWLLFLPLKSQSTQCAARDQKEWDAAVLFLIKYKKLKVETKIINNHLLAIKKTGCRGPFAYRIQTTQSGILILFNDHLHIAIIRTPRSFCLQNTNNLKGILILLITTWCIFQIPLRSEKNTAAYVAERLVL